MPTSAELLVDTSVAVPLLVVDHGSHEQTTRAVVGKRLGLAGHAAFETFSVLTRLPAPARRPPRVVGRLLRTNFPYSCYLAEAATRDLLGRFDELGISGGSVYDALVGAAAVQHGLPLATRDGRAHATYRALGVEIDFIG